MLVMFQHMPVNWILSSLPRCQAPARRSTYFSIQSLLAIQTFPNRASLPCSRREPYPSASGAGENLRDEMAFLHSIALFEFFVKEETKVRRNRSARI